MSRRELRCGLVFEFAPLGQPSGPRIPFGEQGVIASLLRPLLADPFDARILRSLAADLAPGGLPARDDLEVLARIVRALSSGRLRLARAMWRQIQHGVGAGLINVADGLLDKLVDLVTPKPAEQPKPLVVHLKLCWLDPNGDEHVFPKDTPVLVRYVDGSKSEHRLADDGLLKFTAERPRKAFFVGFEFKDATFLSTPPASGLADTLEPASKLKELADKGHLLWQLPAKFTQVVSDWTADGAPTRTFGGLENPALTAIGSEASPRKLVLDPHWQHLRFEYFDRFFGHAGHGDQRVPVPPLFLEGWAERKTGRGVHRDPDTKSNWMYAATDAKKASHCVPWVVQRSDDGDDAADVKDVPKPDTKIGLQFQTEKDTYVFSESKDLRTLQVAPPAAKLKASAERLKYYDLPPLWKPLSWFARQGAGGKFFESLTDADMKASLAPANRLCFCLDDPVLADDKKKQIVPAATDRLAVFDHRFKALGGASSVGVHRPDTTGRARHYSKDDVHTKGYVTDHPLWTRLIVTQQNLFDVFAERLADEGSNGPVGARAAVRWVDAPATGQPPGSQIAAMPARTDKDFISIQPFFTQAYSQTNVKYTGAGSPQQNDGRFDIALLRCCDHDHDTEVVVLLHYLRLDLAFKPDNPNNTVSKYHSPDDPNWQQNRERYVDDCCANVPARLNGDDAVNTSRAELVARDPAAHKLRGQAVYFLQPAPKARAHFTIQVCRPGAGTAKGRAWMFALNGTGEFGEGHSQADSSHAPGSFTAAHEVGHGAALPDEYNERWSAFSYGERSIWMRIPGDPFETDGMDWDPAPKPTADTGLMNGVVQLRNRYFWQSAEFARVITGVALRVKHTAQGQTYDKFEVPPHEDAPRRNYVYWPIQDGVDATHGARGKFDLLLYAHGEDRFTKHKMPKGPFEGTLCVSVKLLLNFDATLAPSIADILPLLRTRALQDHGDKFYATGRVRVGTPQAWTFKKCMIRLLPRFLVSTGVAAAQQASYNALKTHIGTHFTVDVNATNAAPNSRWAAPAPNRSFILEIDPAAANWKAAAKSAFSGAFAEMLGIAGAAAVNKAALLPLVQQVVTSGATVEDL